jgi:hypothetical protein
MKPGGIKSAMLNASPDLVHCLCECIHNVSKGNIPIAPKAHKKLRRHRKQIRQILNRKVKAKRKKQLLSQTGGFLPLLLAPIISVLGGFLGETISSAIRGSG